MATTIINARTTNGTTSGVQLATVPDRIEIRGTFQGAELILEISDDDTNYAPMTGPDGRPLRFVGPSAVSVAGMVSNDYVRGVVTQAHENTSITVEAI